MVDWAGQSAQGRPWAEIHNSVGTKVATGVSTLQPMGATPALSLIYLLGEFSLPGGQQWIAGFLGGESRVALQTQSPIRKKDFVGEAGFVGPIPGEWPGGLQSYLWHYVLNCYSDPGLP